MAEGVSITDEVGVILFTNPALDEMFGYEAGALVGQSVSVLSALSDERTTARIREVIGRLRAKGSWRGQFSNRKKDGTEFFTTATISAAEIEGALCWICIHQDVTDRLQAERALRESEQRYRILFEVARDSIFLLDPGPDGELIIVDTNDAACRMHGYQREELIGKPITLLDVPADAAAASERAARVLEGETVLFEALHVRKDGSVFPVEVVAQAIMVDGRPMIHGVDRDISDRKHAEEETRILHEQLRHTQKMDSLGTLAGGVAHDMNNILGTVMMLSSTLATEMDASSRQQEDLHEILSACERGRDLTRNLLGFARKGRYLNVPFDLNKLVIDVEQLLSRTISKKITTDLVLQPDIAKVKGDPGQVQHAMMNLCLNATEAMAGFGTLTITTANVELDAMQLSSQGLMLQPGPFVRLEVTDTGSGMDAQTAARIFDPFFTTKAEGRGRGLGLSMVYGTMSNHGGMVSVHSVVGTGTTMTLHLPAIASGASEAPRALRESVEAAGSVLLVDDEQMVRHAAGRLLEAMGYKVVVADGGVEAMKLAREHIGGLTLVILDLIMPEMDGAETLRALKKEFPDLPVLLSSGYTRASVSDGLMAAGAAGFIEKPFDRKQLAAHLDRIIHRVAPSAT